MIRAAAIAALIALAGCAPSPPAAPPAARTEKPSDQLRRALWPETKTAPASKARQPAATAKQAKPRKAERPKRANPKVSPKPKARRPADGGPDLPWSCFTVRWNACGKSEDELKRRGEASGIGPLSPKQRRQAAACLKTCPK